MDKRYRNLPTAELESLLRRPDTSPAEQQLISSELDRRYTEEWLGPQEPVVTPQPVAPPPQPVAPPRQPYTPPPQAAPPGPVAPAPVPAAPKKSSAGQALAGCVVAFLVVIAAGVVLAIINGSSSEPQTGNVCYVQGGSCPLAAAVPRGSSCYCTDGFNTAYGVVG
ncbi:hypothetical protein Lesp02_24150 [Lentzea sp. NBRC 105346]|uniref:hypothetical protein n=1 Tax=Lentzea sp. NBRC 105346 TaxID=3032205 RepID=UPI0024A2C169|nr:hypothetical protein [Lentzea sp. NBRC 105346]GLZ30225.1 hypothetical protein Lesp02_24150 [Lentzea sp. NBRC 105346]